MTTLRAHFDGHVFIPDEPVDLPPGSNLEIHIRRVPAVTEPKPIGEVTIGRDPITGFPVLISPPGSPPLTLEDMRRADEDDV